MTNGVTVDEVCFDVTIPGEGLPFEKTPPVRLVVRGCRYRPASTPDCNDSVLLLLHGVSQGLYVWDLPIDSYRYSVARPLTSAGYPVVAIDRLGYGLSSHPDGSRLTIQTHADVVSQIVGALRAGTYRDGPAVAYGRVGLFGHSMGTEIAELCAGQHGGVDILVSSGYTHGTSLSLLGVMLPEVIRAIFSPYVYFGNTPTDRAALFYDGASAVPAVVADETSRANLTPSGEIVSVISRPSAAVLSAIAIPVLLVLADNDRLFPAADGPFERNLFGSPTPPSVLTVPRAGHVIFLHPSGPPAVADIIAWLGRHPTELPVCAIP